MMSAVTVRDFHAGDILALLSLMRALAVFEGYDRQFAVTADDLATHGLGPDPLFGAKVAVSAGGDLVGMAVHHTIRWTYDRRPTLVLKELYVCEDWRGAGVGHALMQAVASHACTIDAPRLHWLVLPDNQSAMRFYRSLGGEPVAGWQSWHVQGPALARLAGDRT